jgi:hypothetical protein
MTNITLSIKEEEYKKMKEYSEIKWSEFVRKCIKQRLLELQKIDIKKSKENILTMLASGDILKKDWDNKLDRGWNNV